MLTALSRLVFGIAGLVLIALAAGLIGYGVLAVARRPWGEGYDIALLDAIGYVIIAIAVFDVAKYLLEEEVIREREMRHVSEARRSITRFVSIVIIAALLEGIVILFKAREETSQLVYPVLVLLAGVALIVGLGIFQRLSASAERDVKPSDDKEEKGPAKAA
jgi:high-affinity Fe2+/Pb2+ permease